MIYRENPEKIPSLKKSFLRRLNCTVGSVSGPLPHSSSFSIFHPWLKLLYKGDRIIYCSDWFRYDLLRIRKVMAAFRIDDYESQLKYVCRAERFCHDRFRPVRFQHGCAARAFCDCPAIISHRPRSQNISKEPQLNPEEVQEKKDPDRM